MKPNYYKKQMNAYKYNTSNSVYQEIEEIRRIQKESEKQFTSKKASNILQKILPKKKRKLVRDYAEIEFLGI